METEIDIEKEVQARIEFKMNEFMGVIRNAVKFKYRQAFDMTQKSQHVWQAFEEIEQMLKKEMWMPPPCNEMDKRAKWEAKEKAVNNIAQSLQLRGHDEMHKRRIIAREVENAQNYSKP